MVFLWDRVEPYQKCTASHHSWITTGYDIKAVCYPTPLMFIEITVYQYLDAKSFSNWRWEDGMISISLPPSISFLWPSLAPLVQIYFSPKPTAAVKIKDGLSFNFHQQNTEHSFVKSPGSAGVLIPTSVTPEHSTLTCMILIMVTYLMLVSDFFLLCKDKRGLALDGKLKHEDTNLASSTM